MINLRTHRDPCRYGRCSWLKEKMTVPGISVRSWSPQPGRLVETGDLWEPYCLSDPGGGRVEPVSEFLRDLQAAGRPATTQRSYSLALLRWFRFTWAVDVPWDQATRTEARDFCRCLQLAASPDASGPCRLRCRASGPRPRSTRRRRWRTARRCCRELLRLSPGGRDRADREPVPAGQAGPGARASQPDGPVPAAAVGPVPAAGCPAGPAADPG